MLEAQQAGHVEFPKAEGVLFPRHHLQYERYRTFDHLYL